MNLKRWSVALFAIALVAPFSASALGISIASTSASYGNNVVIGGDTITINLLLENATTEDIYGLGIVASGYDEGAQGAASDNHLVYSSGVTTSNVFNVAPGVPISGLPNVGTFPSQQGSELLVQTLRATLFNGISTTAHDGNGLGDVGIGGGSTSAGDVHMSVTFSAQALGATAASPAYVTLAIGVGAFGSDVITTGGVSLAGSFTNANITVTVVPEPGTALLMGLGLVGLAGIRRQ